MRRDQPPPKNNLSHFWLPCVRIKLSLAAKNLWNTSHQPVKRGRRRLPAPTGRLPVFCPWTTVETDLCLWSYGPLDPVAFLAPSLPLPTHPLGQRRHLAMQQVVSRPRPWRSLTVVSRADKTEERTNTAPSPPLLVYAMGREVCFVCFRINTSGRVHVDFNQMVFSSYSSACSTQIC